MSTNATNQRRIDRSQDNHHHTMERVSFSEPLQQDMQSNQATSLRSTKSRASIRNFNDPTKHVTLSSRISSVFKGNSNTLKENDLGGSNERKQYVISAPITGNWFCQLFEFGVTNLAKQMIRKIFESGTFCTMCSLFVGFFFIMFLFSVLLYLVDEATAGCIQTSTGDISEMTKFHKFWVVVSLSWTTFSTVGYGFTFPSNSTQNCRVVEIICMLESFVGVLYASFCGAIFYAKVSRVKDTANVNFTESICITFNQGNSGDLSRTDSDDDVESNPNSSLSQTRVLDQLECPVLAFRIVNMQCNESNGEILDANIRCTIGRGNLSGNNHLNTSKVHFASSGVSTMRSFKRLMSSRSSKVLNVDQSSDDLTLLNPECYYFKRIWSVYHKLDHNSSLLRGNVQDEILRNNGRWPQRLSNFNAIRQSMIPYDELIVTLTGKYNGHSVFSQKVYSHLDIIIGYKFSDMEKYDEVGENVKIDLNMLNVVTEQDDGGAEPLISGDELFENENRNRNM